MANFEKILKVVLLHIVNCEGTDFLDGRGNLEKFHDLSDEENAELTRVRDEYRTAIGWGGYPTATP